MIFTTRAVRTVQQKRFAGTECQCCDYRAGVDLSIVESYEAHGGFVNVVLGDQVASQVLRLHCLLSFTDSVIRGCSASAEQHRMDGEQKLGKYLILAQHDAPASRALAAITDD